MENPSIQLIINRDENGYILEVAYNVAGDKNNFVAIREEFADIIQSMAEGGAFRIRDKEK